MTKAAQNANDNLPDDLAELANLHPAYNRLELEEAKAKLWSYFDLVWAIFVRLEREGKLDGLNLTGKPSGPTVKGPVPNTSQLSPPQFQ